MATASSLRSGTTTDGIVEDACATPLSSLLSPIIEARENAWKHKVKDLEIELAGVRVRLTSAEERARRAEAEMKKLLSDQEKMVTDLISNMNAAKDKLTSKMRVLVAQPNVESTSTIHQSELSAQTKSMAVSSSSLDNSVAWLRTVEQSPYFPQVGDELLYLKDVHRQYLDASMIEVYARMQTQLPFVQVPDLPVATRCRLSHVDFDLSIPGVVCLTLTCSEPAMSRLALCTELTVFYRPIPGTPDFLFLQSSHTWWGFSPGNRVWHVQSCRMGTVQYTVSKDYFRRYSYAVLMDGTSQIQIFNPWEVEEIRSSPTAAPAVNPVWKEKCAEMSAKVAKIMESTLAQPFVSIQPDSQGRSKFSSYPVDLTLIKSRLDNVFYRRDMAVMADVNQLFTNAVKTIEPTDLEALKRVQVVRDVLFFAVRTPGRSISDTDWRRLNPQLTSETCNKEKPSSTETVGRRRSLRCAQKNNCTISSKKWNSNKRLASAAFPIHRARVNRLQTKS